ncbi:unnamed protein product [Clonostachys solani]|uniref:Uncharacterized protein n=1 Tax=Clonostachys solani TaxID=160281 RepID=A0A9N9YWF1_9HYPO|nr:unnamed protein product [Clonostachys solani]
MLAFKQIILATLGFVALASAATCKTDADCEYTGQKCVILENQPELVLHTDAWLSISLCNFNRASTSGTWAMRVMYVVGLKE